PCAAGFPTSRTTQVCVGARLAAPGALRDDRRTRERPKENGAMTDASQRMTLEGRTAVITGAGGGIGRAIAVGFADAGAKLVLVGRNKEMLAETADALNGAESRIVSADVSQSDDVRRILAETTGAFGTIDVLVNNHGVEGPVVQMADYPEDEFDRVIAIN